MSDEFLPKPDDARKYKGNELRTPESDPDLPQSWQPRRKSGVGGLSRLILLLIVLILLVLPFTPFAGKIKRAINEMVEKAGKTKVVFRDVNKTVEVEVPVTKEVIKEVIKEV